MGVRLVNGDYALVLRVRTPNGVSTRLSGHKKLAEPRTALPSASAAGLGPGRPPAEV